MPLGVEGPRHASLAAGLGSVPRLRARARRFLPCCFSLAALQPRARKAPAQRPRAPAPPPFLPGPPSFLSLTRVSLPRAARRQPSSRVLRARPLPPPLPALGSPAGGDEAAAAAAPAAPAVAAVGAAGTRALRRGGGGGGSAAPAAARAPLPF